MQEIDSGGSNLQKNIFQGRILSSQSVRGIKQTAIKEIQLNGVCS